MTENKFKYIYGPVPSWRLGSSLGIDAVSVGPEKVCSFDCIYCQIGKTENPQTQRKIFVPTEKIISEIKLLPDLKIDYITFSGAGEPTLAENLSEIIKEIRKIKKEKIAIITNSSLMDHAGVRRDLGLADFVIAKLDAPSQQILEAVNKPHRRVKFENILKGLKDFRSEYKGRFALQVMFIEENKSSAGRIAHLAREINADEIQINTPLRPCGLKPLPKEDLDGIKALFEAENIVSVYDAKKKQVKPISEPDTLKRRGKV